MWIFFFVVVFVLKLVMIGICLLGVLNVNGFVLSWGVDLLGGVMCMIVLCELIVNMDINFVLVVCL